MFLNLVLTRIDYAKFDRFAIKTAHKMVILEEPIEIYNPTAFLKIISSNAFSKPDRNAIINADMSLTENIVPQRRFRFLQVPSNSLQAFFLHAYKVCFSPFKIVEGTDGKFTRKSWWPQMVH